MNAPVPTSWNTGYIFVLAAPLVGGAMLVLDPPRWVQLVGVVVIIGLVAAGTALMHRRRGGWLPSDTLPK